MKVTIEQYKRLIKLNTFDVSLVKAQAMDRLVKTETLKKLKRVLIKQGLHKETINYITMMAEWNFGCVETDNYLMAINAYPDFVASAHKP